MFLCCVLLLSDYEMHTCKGAHVVSYCAKAPQCVIVYCLLSTQLVQPVRPCLSVFLLPSSAAFKHNQTLREELLLWHGIHTKQLKPCQATVGIICFPAVFSKCIQIRVLLLAIRVWLMCLDSSVEQCERQREGSGSWRAGKGPAMFLFWSEDSIIAAKVKPWEGWLLTGWWD